MCGGGRISGEGKESKSLIDSKLQIKGFSRASLLAAEEILVKLNHAACMSHTSLQLGLLRQQRRPLLRSCKRPPRCISSGPLTSKGSNICRMTEKRSSCFSSAFNNPPNDYCFLPCQLRKADPGNFKASHWAVGWIAVCACAGLSLLAGQ